MKNIVFFDVEASMRALWPLTFTRPAALLRCGILTVAEGWTRRLDGRCSWLTVPLLREKYPFDEAMGADAYYINGTLLPTDDVVRAVDALQPSEALASHDGALLAFRGSRADFGEELHGNVGIVSDPVRLTGPQDIFLNNGERLRADFALLTARRVSQPLHPSCTLIGDPSQLFIEEGATVLCATLNVTDGPVYIGKDAEVMEGCCLRGPLALCEHAVTKMGAKVYGETTIGPYCKVGGEMGNVVFIGYANKAHDGYLGNAVIGEWCNLGAGCVSSNLKNDYSLIRLWSYTTCSFARTKMQFCGLIMGDHSKAGIQTMFNTATVVGVGCNIHGAGFPRTFIPSFSFGGAAGMTRLRLDKFFETARTVMARRHVELTEADERLYRALYELDDYGN